MEVEVYRPIAKITFFTESGELVARATGDPKSAMDDDIVSISTTREMQADSPTFVIELTHRKQWHKWVASNDLVIVKMSRPPEVLETVFVGLVDDCRKNTTISGDEVTRTITVTGRGVAKSILKFDVGVVPEAEYTHTTLGWLLVAGVELTGATPAEASKAVWDVICKPFINYKWSNGKSLFDHTGTNFSDREGLQLLDVTTIMNWEGSIHALLKDIAEEPFYEVFWEVKGDKDTLNIRPTPFNKPEWGELPSITITDKDVVADDLGRSDVETYSIYSVGAKTLFSPQDTYKTFGVKPYWNESYAKKYGNSRLHVETSYTPVANSESTSLDTSDESTPIAIDDSPTSTHVTTMNSLMKDLYNWNIQNNSMLNGTLLVKGSNKYKVGMKLLYESVEDNSKNQFYITSVSHSLINFEGVFTTTLGVTRGMPFGERFNAPWGTYTEYTGLGIIPFDPVGSREALQNEGSMGGAMGSVGSADSASANAVVQGARETLNNGVNGVRIRYVFGGNTPSTGSLDCSSWTQYVFKKYAGMEIGRVTGQQVLKGEKVDKSNLQAGDLVFFKGTYNSSHIYGVSHVGIATGNGDEFIHNSSGANGITSSKLSESYWVNHWLMARRVLPAAESSGTAVTHTGGKGVEYEATGYGATALNLMGGPGWVPTFKTATGTRPVEGRTIAVDRKVIPLHSLVRITCPTYPSVNGDYIAEDVGGAIKGNKIDIYFDDIPPKNNVATRKRLLAFGRRKVYVSVLRKGKG